MNTKKAVRLCASKRRFIYVGSDNIKAHLCSAGVVVLQLLRTLQARTRFSQFSGQLSKVSQPVNDIIRHTMLWMPRNGHAGIVKLLVRPELLEAKQSEEILEVAEFRPLQLEWVKASGCFCIWAWVFHDNKCSPEDTS